MDQSLSGAWGDGSRVRVQGMVLNQRHTPEPRGEQGNGQGGEDRKVWRGARRHPQKGKGLEFTLGAKRERATWGHLKSYHFCVRVLQKNSA